ncbi:hypothetical protein ACFDTO_38365 [Microbacteriaceae bacterium 4G12]
MAVGTVVVAVEIVIAVEIATEIVKVARVKIKGNNEAVQITANAVVSQQHPINVSENLRYMSGGFLVFWAY